MSTPQITALSYSQRSFEESLRFATGFLRAGAISLILWLPLILVFLALR